MNTGLLAIGLTGMAQVTARSSQPDAAAYTAGPWEVGLVLNSRSFARVTRPVRPASRRDRRNQAEREPGQRGKCDAERQDSAVHPDRGDPGQVGGAQRHDGAHAERGDRHP